MRCFALLIAFLAFAPSAMAGLHYSGEVQNPLPAKWRGFLLDHRSLRLLAAPQPASPLHDAYAEARLKLESANRTRALTADETADLGALYVRFGLADKAIAILRPAVRANPDHFHLAANLGTAWQLAGDLEQAAAALDDAVRLAPSRAKPFEQAHRNLVKLRQNEPKGSTALDALFVGKPTDDTVSVVQQLALWLPGDGRLLWQLGEAAFATGDTRMAANILDGCVTEFAMKSDGLRRNRQTYKTASEAETHEGTLTFRSPRALVRQFDETKLPTIQRDGTTDLPWPALAETQIGKKFPPKYLKFVQELDGKRVSIVGFVRNRSGEGDVTEFLFTEFPVGCWFCELPEPAGIVRVQLAAGKSTQIGTTSIKIVGTLKLNRTDPEDYLFTIAGATIRAND